MAVLVGLGMARPESGGARRRGRPGCRTCGTPSCVAPLWIAAGRPRPGMRPRRAGLSRVRGMTVLVVHGSKRGGTAGLAESIGQALRDLGHDVRVEPAALGPMDHQNSH